MTPQQLHLFNAVYLVVFDMARFPEWGAYGPGVAPVLAVSATYVVMVLLGHGVMRVIAGPARADQLARSPR